MSTPDAIENEEFASARRGYDNAAVRAFLRTVAAGIRDLEQTLGQCQDESRQLSRQLDLVQGELVEERRRGQEARSRLELAEALRKDALARALAAEAGRQYAEELLARAESSRARTSPGQDVDLREPAERVRHAVGSRTDAGAWTTSEGERGEREARTAAHAVGVILSETDEGVRALLLDRYAQTEAQVRAIEQAAEALVETTKAQAQRIVDGARDDADRITRSARQIAEAWDGVVAEVHDDIARGGSALSDLRAVAGGNEPLPVESSIRFTTNQALAAAVALHTSARDDLHLAEFWIQEAEQDAGEAAALTSRTILDEAFRLLTMAEELGHPAPDLVEQYGELRRRTERLKD